MQTGEVEERFLDFKVWLK